MVFCVGFGYFVKLLKICTLKSTSSVYLPACSIIPIYSSLDYDAGSWANISQSHDPNSGQPRNFWHTSHIFLPHITFRSHTDLKLLCLFPNLISKILNFSKFPFLSTSWFQKCTFATWTELSMRIHFHSWKLDFGLPINLKTKLLSGACSNVKVCNFFCHSSSKFQVLYFAHHHHFPPPTSLATLLLSLNNFKQQYSGKYALSHLKLQGIQYVSMCNSSLVKTTLPYKLKNSILWKFKFLYGSILHFGN